MEPDMKIAEFNELIGKTLISVNMTKDDEGDDNYSKIIFRTICGKTYYLYHFQDCCERVEINDICGDLKDLVGNPILKAEEVISDNEHPSEMALRDREHACDESFTWTFYKLDTIKGGVTIRFIGTSNGYYCESVSFCRV